jgi:hypothetical protein
MAVLLNLFEVYMKWIQLEKSNNSFQQLDIPVYQQYMYMLGLCVIGI